MTTYHGKNGVIKIGTDVIAEVRSFSVTETAEIADDTVQGDNSPTHLVGVLPWSGSIDAFYFPADTTGQAVLLAGASVALELDPIGSTSGLEKLTGTATITSRAATSDKGDVVSVSFQFTGNGALTHGTIV